MGDSHHAGVGGVVIVKLIKFGDMLISRPAGHDAALAFVAYHAKPQKEETLQIDFDGVLVLAPSFMHEFVNVVAQNYPDTKIEFLPCTNKSVVESLKYAY